MENQNHEGVTRAQAQELDFIIDQQGHAQVASGYRVSVSRPRPEPRYRVVVIPIGLFMSLITLIVSLINPDHRATSSFNAGNSFYDARNYAQASGKYEEAIRLKPTFGEAYNNRGLAYRAKGNDVQALADFDQAIRFMPSSSESYNNRGLVYRATGEYDKAIADFNQAIEHDYFYTTGTYFDNRGVTYCYKDDYDQAIADFDAAIRAIVRYRLNLPRTPEPDEADTANTVDQSIDERLAGLRFEDVLPLVYAHRGLAYLANDNLDKAFSDLDRAIKLQPKLALAYYLRGVAYRASGHYDKAIDDFRKVIDLHDNSAVQRQAESQLDELGVKPVGEASLLASSWLCRCSC
jgi:tetratricopeptide (TPR) repeat protein